MLTVPDPPNPADTVTPYQKKAVLAALNALGPETWTLRAKLLDLVHVSGMKLTDRKLRAVVAAMVMDGFPVLTRSRHGGGYRLAMDPAEAEKSAAEYESRARKLFARARELRRAARRMAEQIPLDEAMPGVVEA